MRALLLTLAAFAFLLVGCDSDPNPFDYQAIDLNPDDVTILSIEEDVEADENSGELDVTYTFLFRNDSEYDLSVVEFTVRLNRGSLILAAENGGSVAGVQPGRSATAEVRFFNLDAEVYADVECFDYDLLITTLEGNTGFGEASYSGSC